MELTFGEKIPEFGKAVNMTQRKISYMEDDKYEPGMDDLKALCRFFNVSADYLLGFPNPLPYPKKRK